MDLNDKTIASLQLNVSFGFYNLKLQALESNFDNCPGIYKKKTISHSVSIFVTFQGQSTDRFGEYLFGIPIIASDFSD